MVHAQQVSPSAAPSAVATDAAQDVRTVARTRFDQGVRAIDDGRFADAVTALEESYRLRPAPVVLNNLGIAYRGVGRTRDAINAFNDYLADPPSRATEAELAAVRAEVERLERDSAAHPPREVRGARLLVDPSLSRASVTIDGVLAGTGRVERPVDPGEHRVQVRARGYETVERTVRVGTSGVTRLDVTMSVARPMPGWFAPVVVGAGALVLGVAVTGAAVAASRAPDPWGEAGVPGR